MFLKGRNLIRSAMGSYYVMRHDGIGQSKVCGGGQAIWGRMEKGIER